MANSVTAFAAGARGRWLLAAFTLISAVLLGAAPPAMAQFMQQGGKLVGRDYVANPDVQQGNSVALSADGNAAIVGGNLDNANTGAAWAFSRSSGVWTQEAKLVGSGAVGAAFQGASVALSATGNIALVGGYGDNSDTGAAWVFTQSGGVWIQEVKLVGSGAVGAAFQGGSVALSAAGNTAIVAGPFDNSATGAAWVFTQSGGVWTQEAKLVGSGAVGAAYQGSSVALSADGNTAIVGGYQDNSDTGAAWVFTQSGGVWTQQAKLVGSGAVGAAYQGSSVALSANGSTAIVGGYQDDSGIGAAWVFTQSGGVWTQQGAKLVGSGYINPGPGVEQGSSVALSADGYTAIVGGQGDNLFIGAAWVFTQSSGVWSQLGSKLVGSDAVGASQQGSSVALSADGNTASVGGLGDNSYVGAAWVFTRTVPTNTHDFNDDGVSDILWSDSSGDLAIWLMGSGQFSSGTELANIGTSWAMAGTRDFNGDGTADILWLDGSGDLGIWLMSGTSVSSYASLGNVGTDWTVAGTGDFDGNGTGDILWRNGSTGDIAIWLMRNGAFSSGVDLGTVPSVWVIAGTGDFNADGTTDILWRNTANGELAIWFMSNGQLSSSLNVGRVSTDWSVVGTGDFNGDGVSDILWRDSEGDAAIWLMNNSGQEASGTTFTGIPTTWSVAETGDFNGDGKSDIAWLDQSGDLGVWLMNGLSVSSAIGLGNVGTSWKVQGQNAD